MPDHEHHVRAITPTTQESELLRVLRDIRYGQVTIQVHDGRLVQIERTERFRPDHRTAVGQRSA